MVAPALWAPMRCNWHRTLAPPSLSRQAVTMRRTSSPSERAGLSTILREKVDMVFDLIGGDTQKRSFLVLKEGGHLVATTQPVSQEEAARHRVAGAMMRLAPSADMLEKIARLLERGDDTARRRERVRAPGCGRGLEGHRREPASGSWKVAQLAGSGKTQVTRQDRASCGLEIARTRFISSAGHNQAIHHQGAKETYDDHLRNHRQHTSGPVLRKARSMDSSGAWEERRD